MTNEWVIISDTPDPLDGTPLYWSNADGWVSLDTADVFAGSAKDDNLPIGGSWIEKPEPEPVVSIATGDTVESGDPEHPIRHRTREEWMLAAVESMRPWMAEVSAPVGPVRISFGWPGGKGNKQGVRGQCWMPAAVKDAVPAIFVSPAMQREDTVTILGIILHEMNHAAGHWGHTGDFAKTAKALGFEKPYTSSEGKDDDLKARLTALADELGPLDHGAIDTGEWIVGTRRIKTDPITGEPILDPTGAPPVQSTRMLKCACEWCGYTVRTTRKWIDVTPPVCPDGDCEGFGHSMVVHEKEK